MGDDVFDGGYYNIIIECNILLLCILWNVFLMFLSLMCLEMNCCSGSWFCR